MGNSTTSVESPKKYRKTVYLYTLLIRPLYRNGYPMTLLSPTRRLRLHLLFNRLVLLFLALVILLTLPAYRDGITERVSDAEGSLLSGHTITFPGRTLTDQQGNVLSVIIPLKKAGRLLLMEAIIDGRIGTFILDTGSTGLVLNQTYFRDYLPIEEVDAGGITGSTAPAHRVRIRRLQLSGLVYENLFADVTNLGHIEDRRGIQVFGLFGLNLIKDMEMVIDVGNNELQLHRIDRNGNRLAPSSEKIFYDITGRVNEYRNMAFVEVVIGEKSLEFCLDTGAESNVLDMNLPKKVTGTVSILRRSSLRGAGATSQDVLFGTLTDFGIGGKRLQNMQVMLTNLSGLSQKYGYTIDGMLGYDFFDTGRIYINLVKHELGIVLNKQKQP